MQIKPRRIRLPIDTSKFDGPQDALTKSTARMWNGSPTQFELGLFYGQSLITDLANVVEITAQFKDALNSAAPAEDAALLLSKTVSAFDASLDASTWSDGSKQHAVIILTGAEANLGVGDKWLVIVAALDGIADPVTLAAGVLKVVSDGYDSGAGDPPEPAASYLNAEQSDARYAARNENLADLADLDEARENLDAASRADVEAAQGTADAAIPAAEKGAVDGVAQLDGTGKVPVSQIPDTILGQVEFQGGWNAATNSPAIPAAGAGNKGHYYVVTVAGSSDPDAAGRTWEPGDWLVSNGATWDKIDNTEPVATETLAGISRRATPAEATAGTEAAAHLTPATLAEVDRAYLARINLLLCGY